MRKIILEIDLGVELSDKEREGAEQVMKPVGDQIVTLFKSLRKLPCTYKIRIE